MATHQHKCPRCGHVWRHPDSYAGDTHAHTCRHCGTEVWGRYFGREAGNREFDYGCEDDDPHVPAYEVLALLDAFFSRRF